MMLHLTINCKDLDELKSAKATIDRLVEEEEGRRKADAETARKILNGSIEEMGRRTVEAMKKVMNPPLRQETCNQEWDCPNCGPVTFDNPNSSFNVYRCGLCESDLIKRSQVKVNNRTRSQVLSERRNAVMGGCCQRFANNQGCDCLETAQPDPVERRHTFIPRQPCGDEWQCHNCGTCNAGKAAKCMGCGE